MGDMREQESSTGVINQKIDQILEIVKDLKDKINAHGNEISDLKVQIAVQKQTDDQLRGELKEMKDKSDKMKGQIVACFCSIGTALAVAIILAAIGLR